MQTPPDLSKPNGGFSVADGDRAAFADFLRGARLASGVSLQQIAEQTKVCSRYLEALERGQIEVLPEGLYRRAILRSYAKAVNLDAGTALERFAVTFGSERQQQDLREAQPSPRLSQNTWSLHRGVVALAIGTVAVTLGAAAVLPVALRQTEQEPPPPAPVASGNMAAPAAVVALPVSVELSGSVATSGSPSEPTEPQATSSLQSTSTELVVISSPPGARVTVDGIGWGTTPLTISHLPPGEKVVRVTMDGYLSEERRVRLGDGDSPMSLELELITGD